MVKKHQLNTIFLCTMLCTASLLLAQDPVVFDTDLSINGSQEITTNTDGDLVVPLRINLIGSSATPFFMGEGTVGSILDINTDAKGTLGGYFATITSTNPDLFVFGGSYRVIHDGDNSRFGLTTTMQGKGGRKYGVNASVLGDGDVNYGYYGFARGARTNYGIYASASGGEANYAGFFEGNVEVTDKLTADTLMGDGSLITGLPDDGDWTIDGDAMYNSDKKVIIGAIDGDRQLTIANGNGQLIKQNGSINNAIPLTIELFDDGIASSHPGGDHGAFVDVLLNGTDVHGLTTRVRSSNPDATVVGGRFVALMDGTNNRTGVSGFSGGSGGRKYGLYGFSTGEGTFNMGVYGEARGATRNIGVYGKATGGLINYAGEFIGDVIVEGETETESIVVGNSGNASFTSMQGGTFIIGPDNGPSDTNTANGVAVVTFSFPNAFPSIPKIIVTPSIEDGRTFNDGFSVTTKSITTTSVTFNVYRDDASSEWAQELEVDWFGFSN